MKIFFFQFCNREHNNYTHEHTKELFGSDEKIENG